MLPKTAVFGQWGKAWTKLAKLAAMESGLALYASIKNKDPSGRRRICMRWGGGENRPNLPPRRQKPPLPQSHRAAAKRSSH
jgi:hypothetical protein